MRNKQDFIQENNFNHLEKKTSQKFEEAKRLIRSGMIWVLMGMLILSTSPWEIEANQKKQKKKAVPEKIKNDTTLETVQEYDHLFQVLRKYQEIDLLMNVKLPREGVVVSSIKDKDTLYSRLHHNKLISDHIRLLRDETNSNEDCLRNIGLVVYSPSRALRMQSPTNDKYLIYKNINEILDSLNKYFPHKDQVESVLKQEVDDSIGLIDFFDKLGNSSSPEIMGKEFFEYVIEMLKQKEKTKEKKIILAISALGFGKLNSLKPIEEVEKLSQEKNIEIAFLAHDANNFKTYWITLPELKKYYEDCLKKGKTGAFGAVPKRLGTQLSGLNDCIQIENLYREEKKQRQKKEENFEKIEEEKSG